MALLTDIAPYGTMGCWKKAKTKNGQSHEIPLPLAAHDVDRRLAQDSALLQTESLSVPRTRLQSTLSANMMLRRWEDLRHR